MLQNGLPESSPALNPLPNEPASCSVSTTSSTSQPSKRPPLVWDWAIEHEDRNKERRADQALRDLTPFEVDRKLLKDVVREKMGVEVGRIKFLSAGTFHKAYLVTLVDYHEVVARVARRFMPRLKTESEVATLDFLRHRTNVPVPIVYHYDSNPYNRLGGEFILMSKAPGIPLAQVYHGMAYNDLVKLLKNLAAIIIPLFAHRFPQIGSLYFGRDPNDISSSTSTAPTPKAHQYGHYAAFPFSPTLAMSAMSSTSSSPKTSSSNVPTLKSLTAAAAAIVGTSEYHVGPIISWPFFGSNRGELMHPEELNRGPWKSTDSYLCSCVEREIQGVIRESEGKSAPHRLHLDPDEIHSSRHHRLRAVPGDQSDDSDEWNLEESEDEWEGPGDAMYRDYRRNQRSTFLLAHMKQREEIVRKEMGRWRALMAKLVDQEKRQPLPCGSVVAEVEEFGLDCHDLSLENVFVDEHDNTKITCIIDWESTTTRPLWACAHIPAFLQSSPFVAKLFREAVASLPNDPQIASSIQLPLSSFSLSSTGSGSPASSLSSSLNGRKGPGAELEKLCREWLYHESAGMRLRMAHRCAEWDGWEEGLVDSIIGPEELEVEWLTFGVEGRGGGRGGKRVAVVAGESVMVPPGEEGEEEQEGRGYVGPVVASPRSGVPFVGVGVGGGGGVGVGGHGFVRLGVEREEEAAQSVNGFSRGMVGGVGVVQVGAASSPRVGVGAHRSPFGNNSNLARPSVPSYPPPANRGRGGMPHLPHLAHLTKLINGHRANGGGAAMNGRSGGPGVNGAMYPPPPCANGLPASSPPVRGGVGVGLGGKVVSKVKKGPMPVPSSVGVGVGVKLPAKIPLLVEKEKEQILNTTGDICGGRGGELGRRLEAWLSVEGPSVRAGQKRWTGDDEDEGLEATEQGVGLVEDKQGVVQVEQLLEQMHSR